MKMVYLFNHMVIENRHIGIRKKIRGQMKAFAHYGYHPYLIVLDEFRLILQSEDNLDEIKYFETAKMCYEYAIDLIKKIKPDLIYMRHHLIENHYIFDFCKNLCKNYKVVYEFYTFPYDSEYSPTNKNLICDQYYREKLKNFLKITVNYNGMKEILGIPSIAIGNGVNIDTIPMKSYNNKDEKTINLIGIALISPWHGYDRIIEGLHIYYNILKKTEFKIKFHIVGEGSESTHLRELVKLYKLEDYVVFYGVIFEEKKIENIIEQMDIGIGTLGLFRNGYHMGSPLKSAEYCVRGIPIIMENYEDFYLKKQLDFILRVESSNSPINMEKVIEFYKLYCNKEVGIKIRNYAEENLSWKKMIGIILKEVNI